jgi:hypothetical protein
MSENRLVLTIKMQTLYLYIHLSNMILNLLYSIFVEFISLEATLITMQFQCLWFHFNIILGINVLPVAPQVVVPPSF